ncbi:hypothetical protein Tco_0421366 [Tanacetum coccineum]
MHRFEWASLLYAEQGIRDEGSTGMKRTYGQKLLVFGWEVIGDAGSSQQMVLKTIMRDSVWKFACLLDL